MDQSPELPNNAERVSLDRLARNSVFELILTTILLFGVVSIVRWVIGPSPISRTIPGIHAELCIVGAAVACLLAGLILTPPGRASGGHMNPAISLAMWRFGVFPEQGSSPTPSHNYSVPYSGWSPLAGCGAMLWRSRR